MKHDVFISFSSKDELIAHRIYDGLKNRGVLCWISSRDIPPGGNYQNEIVRALRSASVMVLVFSHNANASNEIKKELALASQYQLMLIPIKIDDAKPIEGLIYSLSTNQWVEIFPDIENKLDCVVATVKSLTEIIIRFEQTVRDIIEGGGQITLIEQKFLEQEGVKMGLSTDKVQIIIREIVGDNSESNLKEKEKSYLQLIVEILDGGKISPIGQKILASRAKSLGISDARADELLNQEKVKLGIFDASIYNPNPSPYENPSEISSIVNAVKIPGVQEQKLVGINKLSVAQSQKIMLASSTLGAKDYFILGNMIASDVLSHSDSDDLIQIIADVVEKTTQTIKGNLKKFVNHDGMIKDIIRNYQEILEPYNLGERRVGAAKQLCLESVISQVFGINDIALTARILEKSHSNMLLKNAFYTYWQNIEDEDEDEDEDKSSDEVLEWDYFSIGEMKAADVLSHSESEHFIDGISMFSDEDTDAITECLEGADADSLVKDVIAGYQDLLDPYNLSSYTVSTAKCLNLEFVISKVFNIQDVDLVKRVLDNSAGMMHLKRAFSDYWPKAHK